MNSSKNIVNNDDKNFQCEICEKLYTTKHCLKNHIDKCHHENNMPKKLYKCHICNKELHSNPYLDTHIKIVHEGKKPHKCKMCNKSFTDAGTVKKHIFTIHEKTHINLVHGAWRGTCDLSNHIHTTHDCRKKEKCNICGKFFCTKYDLKKHINSVHEFRCK